MYDAPKAQLVDGAFSYKDTMTMGHVAHGVIGDMMYSIMFIADHGKVGMPWSQAGPVQKPPKGSIDGADARGGDAAGVFGPQDGGG